MIRTNSSLSPTAGTHISVNRFRIAGDNSFFPKSPPGFIVAMIRNDSAAVNSSIDWLPFSARTNKRWGSKTLFSLSNTASSGN